MKTERPVLAASGLWEVIPMLKNASFLKLFFGNVLIAGGWYWVCFLLCQRLPESVLNPARNRYAARAWEKDGRWYREKLRIQSWKDRIPQYNGPGFSKRNITDDSISYLDRFIRETCRGEWMHMSGLWCMAVEIFINPALVGAFMSLVVLLANLPFAIVQRYNRFRLLSLREKRLKCIGAAGVKRDTVTA